MFALPQPQSLHILAYLQGNELKLAALPQTGTQLAANRASVNYVRRFKCRPTLFATALNSHLFEKQLRAIRRRTPNRGREGNSQRFLWRGDACRNREELRRDEKSDQ